MFSLTANASLARWGFVFVLQFWRSEVIYPANELKLTMICHCLRSFQGDTVSPVWQEVTLSRPADLHLQPHPKEEKRRGFVLPMERKMLPTTVHYHVMYQMFMFAFAEDPCHADNPLHSFTAHVSLPVWRILQSWRRGSCSGKQVWTQTISDSLCVSYTSWCPKP